MAAQKIYLADTIGVSILYCMLAVFCGRALRSLAVRPTSAAQLCSHSRHSNRLGSRWRFHLEHSLGTGRLEEPCCYRAAEPASVFT